MGIFSRRSRLLDFHRPHKLGLARPLKPDTLACLRNLSDYKRPKSRGRFPRSRSAAVLVALFIGRGGDLYVILSRRSDHLRSYPGDTSLPGGKLEKMDRSLENAAVRTALACTLMLLNMRWQRREAFEEIGLPLDKTKVPLLCILEPFIAGNNVIVTPVVVLILDQSLRPILNASEVQSLLSHPLRGFLTTSPVREAEIDEQGTHDSTSPSASPTITPSRYGPSTSIYKRPYYTYRDVPWYGKPVRMHSFLTGWESEGVRPVSGLTSTILIRTAQIGYAREPEFENEAPGQSTLEERIAFAMRTEESLIEACQKEGIEGHWATNGKLTEKTPGKQPKDAKPPQLRTRL